METYLWKLSDYCMDKLNWIKINSGTEADNNEPYITLPDNITDAQYNALLDFLYYLIEWGYKRVTVFAAGGSLSYPLENMESPEYIINRIKRAYTFGHLDESKK